MNYWLMKSEPECFSIDDLRKLPKQTSRWDGVRNYQARNFMRQMKQADLCFFYHSNAKPPGIIGIMQVVKEAYPDPTQFDPNSEHPDFKSSPSNPRWDMVDVKFKEKFSNIISLNDLKQHKELEHMQLLQKGNRLSVLPISKTQWDFIVQLVRHKNI